MTDWGSLCFHAFRGDPLASARLISFSLLFRLSLYPCIFPSVFNLSLSLSLHPLPPPLSHPPYPSLIVHLLVSCLSSSKSPKLTANLAPYGMPIYDKICMWLHVWEQVTKIRTKLLLLNPSTYSRVSMVSALNVYIGLIWSFYVHLSLLFSAITTHKWLFFHLQKTHPLEQALIPPSLLCLASQPPPLCGGAS